MAITVLDDSNFKEIITGSDVPVIVDFYADWCGPCKRIAPVLEEIAEEKSGQVLIYKVDVDKSQQLAGAYQVMSIPNIISFKNGEIYKRLVGAVSKEELLGLID